MEKTNKQTNKQTNKNICKHIIYICIYTHDITVKKVNTLAEVFLEG